MSAALAFSAASRGPTASGGAVLGRGADLIVIDDPISGLEAATSAAARRRVQEFYDGTLYSRLNGVIIIVMLRLHEDDLVGQVLEMEDWEVLSIPAIAPEDARYRIGDGAEALYQRRAGEVLHPGRDTIAWLDAAGAISALSTSRPSISRARCRPRAS